ncbi:MAG: hypothetical protein M3487_01600 [Actinomycetota bacterium]|nr:hypothetical protein [Actinomycetota bacterium]
MPLIGGDLAAMSALARRFAAAGSEFRAHADGITRRVADALGEFGDEMGRLDHDARALAEQIDAQQARLRAQSEATVWTGRRRDMQDQYVQALGADIRGVRSSIDGFVDQASSVVRGALTSTMTEMQSRVEATGIQAESTATSFGTAVEQQRAAFDHVMNG